MKGKVRIEVQKNNGNFFYTGLLKDLDEKNYLINTIKGETLVFRKEQVQQIEMIGDDMNESAKAN